MLSVRFASLSDHSQASEGKRNHPCTLWFSTRFPRFPFVPHLSPKKGLTCPLFFLSLFAQMLTFDFVIPRILPGKRGVHSEHRRSTRARVVFFKVRNLLRPLETSMLIYPEYGRFYLPRPVSYLGRCQPSYLCIDVQLRLRSLTMETTLPAYFVAIKCPVTMKRTLEPRPRCIVNWFRTASV
ncbi:hypothetical protein B0H11DRAFT_1336748 [Mycena galericulata]|nr:hypothetical protein B0H11DRAFT_1336748 [Mycena galericulata]